MRIGIDHGPHAVHLLIDRHGEHILGADVPVRVRDDLLAGAHVGRFPQRLEGLDVGDRVVQREPVVRGAHALDRDEPRLLAVTMRRDDDVGDAARDRVHDDVHQLSERRVRAPHAAAEIQPHTRISPPRVIRVITPSG